jgi:hypothetical protein
MAKKSRPENSGTAKIVVLWETLTTALRKCRGSVLLLAARNGEWKINKDGEFRGFFDSSSNGFGAACDRERTRFFARERPRK